MSGASDLSVHGMRVRSGSSPRRADSLLQPPTITMNKPRRTFVIHTLAACSALVATQTAFAQAAPEMVKDSDAAAMAVGYVLDTAKADKRKYPTHAAGQRCGTCVLFERAATESAGPCPLFPGKHVSAGGWCSSWAKKG